jgi:hypothetical protein
MTSHQELYEQWINRLWAGAPVAAELVTDGKLAEYWTGAATG